MTVPIRGGRPKIEFKEKDWKQIENLCKIQCTSREIATVMGCALSTLERNIKDTYQLSFQDYFAYHSEGGKASLRRLQWNRAQEGSDKMILHLSKHHLGQDDSDSDKDKKPTVINVNISGTDEPDKSGVQVTSETA